MHRVKTRDGVGAELRERLAHPFYRLCRLARMALGEEFIGIANDPFLQGFREQVPDWLNGQMLSNNLLSRDTGTRVPLTHPSMPIQSHCVKHLTTDDTVQDVRFPTVAMDARSIGTAHANVVQHCSFLNKLDINRRATINQALSNRDRHVGNLTAMNN